MSVIVPSFVVCAKTAVSGRWQAERFEVEIASAVTAANLMVARGAPCACVMEVGGVDAMPSFTFKYATKGGR